jgi:hypothetical protein
MGPRKMLNVSPHRRLEGAKSLARPALARVSGQGDPRPAGQVAWRRPTPAAVARWQGRTSTWRPGHLLEAEAPAAPYPRHAGRCGLPLCDRPFRAAPAHFSDTRRTVNGSCGVAAGLIPILCVGGPGQRGGPNSQVVDASSKAVGTLKPSAALVIAYEPVWAIGTGSPPPRTRPSRCTILPRSLLQGVSGPSRPKPSAFSTAAASARTTYPPGPARCRRRPRTSLKPELFLWSPGGEVRYHRLFLPTFHLLFKASGGGQTWMSTDGGGGPPGSNFSYHLWSILPF